MDKILFAASPISLKSISTRIDDGGKSRNILTKKMKGTNRSGEGGNEPDMWPRICFTTGEREREKKGEDSKWDGKKKTKLRVYAWNGLRNT